MNNKQAQATPTVILPVDNDIPVLKTDDTSTSGTGKTDPINNDNNNQNADQNKQTTTTTTTTKTDDKIVDTTIQDNNQSTDKQIEIDGKDYKLDDKGNAVDASGNVFMTKEKIDSFLNNAPLDLISEVQKINNIVIVDDFGKPIVYDSTPEGIAKRELDIVNHAKQSGQQEGIDNFLKANPDLAAMHSYKQRYGSLEGYGKTTDYTTLNFDKSNKEQLKQIIIDEQISKGNTIDTAKAFADFAEKNNQLEALGVSAYNSMKNAQVAQQQDYQAKAKKWADSYFGVELDPQGNPKDLKIEGSLYDMLVTKGEFNGLKIPKDGVIIKQNNETVKLTGKDLFAFAAYAGQDGQTQLDKAINNYLSNAANKLTIGMYILKGGDLSELATHAVNKQTITKIKISTQNNQSTSRMSNNNSNASNQKPIVPVQ